jgi:hypothetical protein
MRYKALPPSLRGATPPRRPPLEAAPAGRKMADWLATVMMLAAANAVLVVPLAALASGAVLSASPATTSAGDRIRIVGTGFPRGEEGVLTWAVRCSLPQTGRERRGRPLRDALGRPMGGDIGGTSGCSRM